jgi:hypothetical protein
MRSGESKHLFAARGSIGHHADLGIRMVTVIVVLFVTIGPLATEQIA